ncbi:MAG: isoprenylcysteine carboxylmethyltransferase family protein [Myxococcales bacterium]|nr:isoprenylcysteine carboxylmethyltransferase family protein [Myxococcales bacterium]MCB9718209.1 isoprenylcysteine carboxylmethyltransferase family protein [Myxococcales bacterium]
MTVDASPAEPTPRLLPRILARVMGGIVIMGAMLFWPAGTFRYWPGWLFLASLFVPMMVMTVYFLRRDPKLLERRLKTREQQTTQKWAIAVFGVVAYGSLILAGFDFRYGWSQLPGAVVIVANLIIVLGFAMFFWVLQTNRYAARTVEVEAEQELIDSGPYAIVRHPMYTAVTPIMLMLPLALGSLWALPPMVLVLPVLVVRIRNEEQVLRDELPGYPEYCQRVRWRLVPGLW